MLYPAELRDRWRQAISDIPACLKRLALIFLLFPAACSEPGPLGDMEAGETGRVVRVFDGDALVLDTGQTVRLVSIEAPSFGRDGSEDAVHARESARLLEDLVMGRRVKLFYPGLTRDRYDRALAHVMTVDDRGPELWLNREMVRQGGAWVRLYPDTAALGGELYAAEHAAREEKAGLWRRRAHRIRQARQLPAGADGFRVIRGELGDQVPTLFERVVCAREIDNGAIILDIMPAAEALCRQPAGEVEVRGHVREGRLRLVHPLNLKGG